MFVLSFFQPTKESSPIIILPEGEMQSDQPRVHITLLLYIREVILYQM